MYENEYAVFSLNVKSVSGIDSMPDTRLAQGISRGTPVVSFFIAEDIEFDLLRPKFGYESLLHATEVAIRELIKLTESVNTKYAPKFTELYLDGFTQREKIELSPSLSDDNYDFKYIVIGVIDDNYGDRYFFGYAIAMVLS